MRGQDQFRLGDIVHRLPAQNGKRRRQRGRGLRLQVKAAGNTVSCMHDGIFIAPDRQQTDVALVIAGATGFGIMEADCFKIDAQQGLAGVVPDPVDAATARYLQPRHQRPNLQNGGQTPDRRAIRQVMRETRWRCAGQSAKGFPGFQSLPGQAPAFAFHIPYDLAARGIETPVEAVIPDARETVLTGFRRQVFKHGADI